MNETNFLIYLKKMAEETNLSYEDLITLNNKLQFKVSYLNNEIAKIKKQKGREIEHLENRLNRMTENNASLKKSLDYITSNEDKTLTEAFEKEVSALNKKMNDLEESYKYYHSDTEYKKLLTKIENFKKLYKPNGRYYSTFDNADEIIKLKNHIKILQNNVSSLDKQNDANFAKLKEISKKINLFIKIIKSNNITNIPDELQNYFTNNYEEEEENDLDELDDMDE